MAEDRYVTVRLFGALHTLRREQGMPAEVRVEIADEGVSARDLAVSMHLPVDKIEGVFCNHTVYDLDHVIHPGDEVAFVPHGTPGPHRYFLGLYEAGSEATDT